KYYLCDATYTHTKGFMTPYRNTRYWLRIFDVVAALERRRKNSIRHTLNLGM
ncbi:hypothetical protein MKW98_023769, partial [Papaver atlanticum]